MRVSLLSRRELAYSAKVHQNSLPQVEELFLPDTLVRNQAVLNFVSSLTYHPLALEDYCPRLE